MVFISIGTVSRIVAVSTTTLRRYDSQSKLKPAFRTCGGHRRYNLKEILSFCNQHRKTEATKHERQTATIRAITYARVSASKQKEDLKRQQDHLETYVINKQWKLIQTYQDIGSGLNDNRKGLLRLIRELPVIQPDYLVCSYSDRLARFGTKVIKVICAIYDTKIIVTNETEIVESLDGQLVKDVIAVITSFAGTLYRRRRGKLT